MAAYYRGEVIAKTYPERLDTVVAIGEGQGGYFTTEQARVAGLSIRALMALEHGVIEEIGLATTPNDLVGHVTDYIKRIIT